MAFTFSPVCPGTGPWYIDREDCIGDSLVYINANTGYLDCKIKELNTLLASVSSTLATQTTQAVPAGAVYSFVQNTPPTGWLECNGVTVPNGNGTVSGVTANFANLYAAVGSKFGSVGTLPDLRGEFIRGWDNSRGIDSGRVFGTLQTSQLGSHNHTFSYTAPAPAAFGGGTNPASPYVTIQTNSGTTASTGGTSNSSETRPRNVALLYCIKY